MIQFLIFSTFKIKQKKIETMKKILFILALFSAFCMLSCQKTEMVYPKTVDQNNNDDDDDDDSGYVWTGQKPAALTVYKTSRHNSGSGNTGNYTYYHKIPLDNSPQNPTGQSLAVPHVGPGGVTIYSNVANDATYTIEKIENGHIYLAVTTDNVVTNGCVLEFNISIGDGSGSTWFLAYGQYSKKGTSYTYDDGQNNVYRIRYLNGTAYPDVQ